MAKKLELKLKELPKQPGVYFHKNAGGSIIYIGKAANLRNRVRQYFQTSRNLDPKTEALVAEITDVDWITVESEIDALFLEAEMVRRYLPPYNILLRDDKSSAYVRIDYDSDHPTVTITRRPLDDDAKYFGPFFMASAVKRALKYLRRAFPYSTHLTAPRRACLLYHLGLCPGIEEDKTTLANYRANLRKLIAYLKGERVKLLKQLEKEMKIYAQNSAFEQAATARNQLFALRALSQQIIFSDKEFMDISKDQGLAELAELLGLYEETSAQVTQRTRGVSGSAGQQTRALRKLRVIEGYDISHMSGTDTVASMVQFTNGLPNKVGYRKFKMRLPGNDDFAHMREVITRRLSEDNRKKWGVPDLFLIDGGKGQVSAALGALHAAGLTIPMVGLAKREEIIIIPSNPSQSPVLEYQEVRLDPGSHALKLLQRIRDESHRFAVSYHSVLKTKRQTASLLDEIPTIGPVTRKKLIKTFGSLRGVHQARQEELQKLLGPKKAIILRQYLRAQKP